MKPDLFPIHGPWPGTLAVAARPRGGDWLASDMSGWHEAGLDVVVSLLEKDEAAQLELDREADLSKANGIQFLSFPIPDRGVPASTSDALALLRKVAVALEHGKNVAVHCRQGIGRSGLIAAGLLMTSGMSVDQAIEAVSAARGVAVPETSSQLRWLKQLPSAHLVPA